MITTEENNYRIKSESKYRPFESAEEVMAAVKEHGSWLKGKIGTYCQLKWIFPNGGGGVMGREENYTPDGLYANYTFADGTPFGKLEE